MGSFNVNLSNNLLSNMASLVNGPDDSVLKDLVIVYMFTSLLTVDLIPDDHEWVEP
jgi:hypothetical protein